MKTPECKELSVLVQKIIEEGPDGWEKLGKLDELANVETLQIWHEDVTQTQIVEDMMAWADRAMSIKDFATRMGYMVFTFGGMDELMSYNFLATAKDEEELIDMVTRHLGGLVIGDTKSKITRRMAERRGIEYTVLPLVSMTEEDLSGLPRTKD